MPTFQSKKTICFSDGLVSYFYIFLGMGSYLWHAISLLSTSLKSPNRDGDSPWSIYWDEQQAVQCGDIHSISIICEKKVHGTESCFTLGCWHWECGDSGEHLAEIPSCYTMTAEFLKKYGPGCSLNSKSLWMARHLCHLHIGCTCLHKNAKLTDLERLL